jgi:hypothetical protein
LDAFAHEINTLQSIFLGINWAWAGDSKSTPPPDTSHLARKSLLQAKRLTVQSIVVSHSDPRGGGAHWNPRLLPDYPRGRQEGEERDEHRLLEGFCEETPESKRIEKTRLCTTCAVAIAISLTFQTATFAKDAGPEVSASSFHHPSPNSRSS